MESLTLQAGTGGGGSGVEAVTLDGTCSGTDCGGGEGEETPASAVSEAKVEGMAEEVRVATDDQVETPSELRAPLAAFEAQVG